MQTKARVHQARQNPHFGLPEDFLGKFRWADGRLIVDIGECLKFIQRGSFLSLDRRCEGKALGAGDAIF